MTAGPEVLDLLARWMPAQRWYPAKGRGVGVRDLGGSSYDAGGVEVVVHVLGLDSGDRVDVVQVPLAYRAEPLEGGEPALVGTVDGPDGLRWVYDGPHDPAYVAALLAALERPAGRAAPAVAASHVLRGEQSNTSVIVQTDTEPVIVKVFRTLHPGDNPDVEVLRALTGPLVPGLVGWASGTWQGPDGAHVSGHLAVATEFVSDGRDAWREAVEAVDADRDFSAQARELGAATARLHRDLAAAFGTRAADAGALAAALRARVDWALRSTDALARHRSTLESHAASLTFDVVPDLQRVHGDYHLGQVLHSPRRGWVVLDFEGEPLRPLHERTQPDLALRDVAGMLRSFDYAAGQVRVRCEETGDVAAADAAGLWAESARDAFCAGYGDVSGADPRAAGSLLAALELDKALYEVVYEAGNRPAWVDVPLGAVGRLLGSEG